MIFFFYSNRDDKSLENDVEDGETSGLARDCKELDKFGRETPTDSPAISGKADTPIPEACGSHDGIEGINEDDKAWPSVVDLNTRLRRVISSYQRSVKKDDNKIVQKTKQGNEGESSNHNNAQANIEPPLNMQGWDLQQLAMYLLVSNQQSSTSEIDFFL